MLGLKSMKPHCNCSIKLKAGSYFPFLLSLPPEGSEVSLGEQGGGRVEAQGGEGLDRAPACGAHHPQGQPPGEGRGSLYLDHDPGLDF